MLGTGMALSALGCTGTYGAGTSPTPVTQHPLQAAIPDLRVPETVSVVGVGGFGSWPALFSALAGVRRLILFDPASIDAEDFSKTPFGARQLGTPKVEAMRSLITQLRPGTEVEARVQYFVAGRDEQLLEGSVLFDGVNDLTLTQQLPQIAAARGMGYATGFYSGTRVGVSNAFVPGIRMQPGQDVPVWPVSAALAGILAVHSAFVQPLTFVGGPEALHMSEEDAGRSLASIDMVDK